ncbi:DUF1329 domain-containing protein [Hahella aquimaris]|uniref:DUF1329 domain-containing protein n=1 Tax=Hahella sp. HNIBRBA332 TaxID=3015983 RepID=UPI00273B4468|nr:DUF1329 domain-containing protein [Hahella sp. HNIBRBA332]WLQ14608.1 DUF1329 domain-containing protein [Hahella sp. HNIBRBA332]
MRLNAIIKLSALALAISSSFAWAKAPAGEAAKLGDTLTPIGAEKAGNADGTIPAWDGGLKTIPAGYDGVDYINPFAAEKPKFVISASNADQYKDNLSAGQMAMLKKYPGSYKIKVYPTHRTSAYEQKIYDAAKHNATSVELVADGNGITDYQMAVAFPILSGSSSDQAKQIIWNHITRWRGGSLSRRVAQVTPLANGDFTPVIFSEQLSYVSSLSDYKSGADPNVIFYFKQEIESPARLAGNVLLVHETLNQVKEPRRAWIYNEGQRRVRRAPQVAYDGPGTASDGLRTTDNFDMFNGAPDRYDWKVLGKKEIYLPYNAYDLSSKKVKYSELVQPGHLNQEMARYELHRVWVVEGTLKPGSRHIYAKRVFYVDEDTWQIGLADHYDGRGELWRVAEGHHVYFYDQKISWFSAEVLYDLLSGRYLALGLTNEEPKGYEFNLEASSQDFTPAALRRSGRK